jgi:hypothetical protein
MSDVHILTIEEIAAAADCPDDTIEVPRWGGWIKVRGITVGERQQILTEATIGGVVDADLRELLWATHGIVDPPMTKDHVDLLRGKGSVAFDQVMLRIFQLSGLAPESIDDAKRTFRSRPGKGV